MDLAQVLSRLPLLAQHDVIVGFDTADDAGAVRLADGSALVATLDFIMPLVDDAATFGAIAAANAVSDVYAMGARPLLALSIACFPEAWPLDVLGDICRGGGEKLGEAACPVIGGHTVVDPEMKFGYAVIGVTREGRLWRNSTAKAGDRLLLTKAVGTGILAAAARSRRAPASQWSAAVAQMCALNRAAAEALADEEVHAATDVSGFGLVGHAAEMARGSQLTVRIRGAAVPVLDGALEQARDGQLTRARVANMRYVEGDIVLPPGIDPALVEVLHDPQTSGGLLLAVPADSPATARLKAAGCTAWEIGAVEAFSGHHVVIE